MYKVFFNENEIIISDQPVDSLKSASKFSCENPGKIEISSAFKSLDPNAAVLLNFWGRKDTIWNSFKEQFTWIEAAGGWVLNTAAEVLLIYRLEKWDLPKGKVEVEEGIEEAAIREVEEETGISGLEITEQLAPSFHIYPRKGKMYLKQTHWFKMKTEFKGDLVPQLEEDIEQVTWVPLSDLKPYMTNTYPAIAELMQEQMQ